MQLFFIMLSKRETHNNNISIMYQYYALYHYVNIYHVVHVFHVLFVRFMLLIYIVYGDEHVCLCQIKPFDFDFDHGDKFVESLNSYSHLVNLVNACTIGLYILLL